MHPDAWPTPQEPSREPLPRVEDLPIAEQGYEQDSVKAAFDSFYRHAAQLDAALRTLEAVDSFHRQAAALRADLRSLRTAGWTQQPWGPPPAYGYTPRSPREGISPAVWRIAGEVALIIAVAVGLGVAKAAWWVIVLVLGLAWLIVAGLEWTSSRDRWSFTRPRVPFGSHPVVEGASGPSREKDDEASGWSAFEAAQEPSDAMTMIGALAPEEGTAPESPSDAVAEEPTPEPQAAPPDEPVGEEEPEELSPVLEAPVQSRRWWQRDKSSVEDEPDVPEPPRHVRVLDPGEGSPEAPDEEESELRPADEIDPWERGFDAEVESSGDAGQPEVGEDTDEGEPAVAAEQHEPSRRRFRRR